MILDRIPCQTGIAEVSPFRPVRLKVTDKCPFSCSFCHHEGSFYIEDIEIDTTLVKALKELRYELGLDEAHLTGGEPTSHPEIERIIGVLAEIGYTVKMTSNGQFRKTLLKQMRAAGLASINYSIHSLQPHILSRLQKPVKDESWGRTALSRQLRRLEESIELGMKTKINTVVTDRSGQNQLGEIIELCRERRVELRILDDLDLRSAAVSNISDMLLKLDGTIDDISVTEGSSGYSYGVSTTDGFRLRVKSIRKCCLRTMCSYCEVRDTCKEWFYGIRIEQKAGRAIVRLCIHRQDYPAVQNIFEFLSSIQYDELKEICKKGTGEVITR